LKHIKKQNLQMLILPRTLIIQLLLRRVNMSFEDKSLVGTVQYSSFEV
jgi:hypothetical protein